MSKNNYINSKILTFAIVAAVTVVCAVSGFVMAGGGVMATAAYGTILGGVIGIAIGTVLDHYYETELSSIIAGIGAVIGGTLGAIYGKTNQEDNGNDPDNLPDHSFAEGISCLGQTLVGNISNLKNCLTGDVASCFEATDGFSEIVTCMGEDNNRSSLNISHLTPS